ncbi:MAG: FeoA domain-containing protein [Methanotrichaceae archaeon]|nr:FeoA domain-containing protein [Methanotrichaceae archaeon]
MFSKSSIRGGRLPLAFLLEGEEGSIIEIMGGRGVNQHLCDMGLTPSTKVKVLKSNPMGPMLIEARYARIALGKGITMKIMVRSEDRI